MARLCERPGCSDAASTAYGMRPEDLVFWLDHLTASNVDAGVLCLRHADAMVVPRGWTLNDLREPHLRLFRPPSQDAEKRGARTQRVKQQSDDTQQLLLSVEEVAAAVAQGEATVEHAALVSDGGSLGDAATETVADGDEPAVDAADGWAPSFDTADDLGGVLSARSPLLARAFRGDDRPR